MKLTRRELAQIFDTVPGGEQNVEDVFPLAPVQEGMWFHHLTSKPGDPYLRASLTSFQDRKQLDRFLAIFSKIVKRHAMLRTAILWERLPQPVHVVLRNVQLPIEEVIFSPDLDAEAALRARFDPRTARIDIRDAPLFRLKTARDERQSRHLLLFLFHHLAYDAVTVETIKAEIVAQLTGTTSALPKPVSFREFIENSVVPESGEDFFRALLGGVGIPTPPFGLVEVFGDGSAIREASLEIEHELGLRLRKAAKKLRVGLTRFYHLAFALMLSRVSGTADVVFGTMLSARGRAGPDEEATSMLGPAINILPVRLFIGKEPVERALRKTHDMLIGLTRHVHAPLSMVRLFTDLPPSIPLFSSVFNYRRRPNLVPPGPEVEQFWRPFESIYGGLTNYPLAVAIDEFAERFRVSVQVQSPVEPLRVCKMMHKALEELVNGLEQDPGASLYDLDILPDEERRRVLDQGNETREECRIEECIHELFEMEAAKNPEAIAVIDEGLEISYRELNARANQLAHYLRELGVRPDERVAICTERNVEMVVGLLAILKAGGAYVPLDPEYPRERLLYMLRDCRPVVLLIQASLEELLPVLTGDLPVVKLGLTPAFWAGRPEGNLGPGKFGIRPDKLAYVIYTSGSTGKPKGVMVEHRSVTRLFSATENWFHFDSRDVWTAFHSYAFDFSVWEIWGALLHGGRLVIIPLTVARSPERFYQLVCQREVTVLNQTPSAFRHLVAAQAKSQAKHSLRHVIFGGEALDVAALQPWYAQNANSPTRLVNMYGITETTVHVTYYPLEQADMHRAGGSPIGRPIPDLRIYLLDDRRKPVPIGASGEMYIGGPGVARGYLNRPELTAERFVVDPFTPGGTERIYKTGDLGRWLDDGNIEFLGRNDYQVKIRGFRIELAEIEARLLEHDEVQEAVVVARAESGGEKRLVAYYIKKRVEGEGIGSNGWLDPAALRDHLSRELPEYMLPAAYVEMEKFPLTRNGKLDRQALPRPDLRAYVSQGYEAPEGELERALAEMWSELLQVERIGRHDNFFELGGHSLMAVMLFERMRQANMPVKVEWLFMNPTIAGLSAHFGVDQPRLEVPPNLIPAEATAITPDMLPLVKLTPRQIHGIIRTVRGGASNVQDIYPLAPLQEGILFHHLMAKGRDPYVLSTLYSCHSRERLDRFLEAWQAVIERHDILRTAVVWEGLPEPLQVVWRRARLPIEEVVLDPDDIDAIDQLRRRVRVSRAHIPIDQAPIMRAYIAEDIKNRRWLLMMLNHHLTEDNTSLKQIRRELRMHLLGRAGELPFPFPFRNFVAEVRRRTGRSQGEAFFREMLGDVDEPTAPFGMLTLQSDVNAVAEADVTIPVSLTQRLRVCVRRLGVSAATLCHVAYAMVLARVSGRDDVVFGTVLFGRMQGKGADRSLGLFINTLPMRIQISNASTEDTVRRAHTLQGGLLRHEHASLAVAQRCSLVAAPVPLFSALLNYRHNPSKNPLPQSENDEAANGIEVLCTEERTNYPLTLSVDDYGDGLRVSVQAESPIEPIRVCNMMHTALERLVEALENAPERPIREVDVLPELERREVLEQWNDTEVHFPTERCVHELFEKQAGSIPDTTAVAYEDKQISYCELNTRANRLAHYLRALGLKPDDRVAICVERSVDTVVGLLGILKAGGAYVPLDPAYPVERIDFMLKDSAPVVLLTQASLRDRLADVSPAPRILELDAPAVPWTNEPSTNPNRAEVGLTSRHLAYVIYTSGSTGVPKGVMMPHCALHNLLTWHARSPELSSACNVLQYAPLSFDVAFQEIFTTLCSGGRLTLVNNETRQDPVKLLKYMERWKIERIFMPFIALHSLAEASTRRKENAPFLRDIVTAGERLRVTDELRQFIRRSAGRRLHNHYGPTETHVVTSFVMPSAPEDWATLPPIGRPIANIRIYILDDRMEPAPVGVCGELYVGGTGVARGYLNQPELTAERFVPDPFSGRAGERMYKTGDLGRWLSDGNIELLGRNDFQVKVRGFRIELGEVEAKLRAHPGVSEATIVACGDESAEKSLVAYYVTTKGKDAGGQLTASDLRDYLRAQLPDYMVPVAYVRLPALPLTPNGKLDRKRLPSPRSGAVAARGYEPPEGDVERTMAKIWSELLKVEQVGRHDNFFELGGHSLVATQLASRLFTAFGAEVPLVDIFRYNTVSSLAMKMKDALLPDHGIAPADSLERQVGEI